MSNPLCFVSLGGRRSGEPRAQSSLQIKSPPGESRAVELWHDGESLTLEAPPEPVPARDRQATRRVAVLYAKPERESHEWYLVRHAGPLTLNGETPAPLLARLEPGSLLAIGQQAWHVSRIWKPDQRPAPPAVAGKNCPHCGGQLRLADVVQCLCGRYLHLERPEAGDDPDVLNCYLQAGPCGKCGRTPSLQTQQIPEPPDVLFDEIETSDWTWQEQLA